LTQFENKFLEAQGEKANREYELFCEIRGKIMEKQEIINNVAFKSTNIDFLASLSQVAYENNYTRPQISNNYDLKIISGKHPIIMKSVPDFISNNLELDNKKFVHIITGPNM
jgi:DNA mismatch repair protein MutS